MLDIVDCVVEVDRLITQPDSSDTADVAFFEEPNSSKNDKFNHST